jgi:hypothetical protein
MEKFLQTKYGINSSANAGVEKFPRKNVVA